MLTGETGAGKSILIDAVSGLLGARLGAESVRAGESTARVEGVFQVEVDDPDLRARLEELGVETEDGTLIVSRGPQGLVSGAVPLLVMVTGAMLALPTAVAANVTVAGDATSAGPDAPVTTMSASERGTI